MATEVDCDRHGASCHPLEVEAVLFDIGDVLEHNPRTGWEARWAQRLGIETVPFARRIHELWAPGSVGHASLAEIEQRTAAAFGLDTATLSALMADWWSEYVGSLNDGLARYLARLPAAGYRTGIVSNSFVGAREREHAAHRLGDLCEVIVYSHEVGYAKPEPEIYRIACARLDVAPAAAVLLDDVPANADGARAIGMHAIVFRDNAQAIAELETLLG